MRKLRTLNRDRRARSEVGKAAGDAQSGDQMDFGLLCYERGLWEGYRLCSRAHEYSLLAGEPDRLLMFFKRELRKSK